MKFKFFLFLLLCFKFTYSQNESDAKNLVQNSNFNSFLSYIDSNNKLIYAPEFWFYGNSNSSHPLYFCTDRFLNPSIITKIHPEGNAIRQGAVLNYIGLEILPKPQSIYTKLMDSLIKGNTYKLSIDVRAYGYSNSMTDLITGFSNRETDRIEQNKIQLVLPDKLIMNDLFQHWIRLNTEFKATGNEKYLIIGSKHFQDYLDIISKNPEKYDHRERTHSKYSINYTIDNIYLEEINGIPINEFIVEMDSLKVDETLILDKLYFDFGTAHIKEESAPFLLQLTDYLRTNKAVRIQIAGHTDNIGTEEFNANLSLERASAVSSFLRCEGISEDRIEIIGFGSKQAIADNDTELGQQFNRRVEIKIINR